MVQLLRLMLLVALATVALMGESAAEGGVPSGETVVSSTQEPLFDDPTAVSTDRKSALVIRGGAVVRKVGGWRELTRHIEDTVLRGAALRDDDLAAQVMKLLGRPLSDDNMLRQVKALLRYRNDRQVLHIQVRLFVDSAGKSSQGNDDDKDGGDDMGNADDNDKDDSEKSQERSGGDAGAGGGTGDHEDQGKDNGGDKNGDDINDGDDGD
jgi:hypothetical protein